MAWNFKRHGKMSKRTIVISGKNFYDKNEYFASMRFLLQTMPALTTDAPFKQWQKAISKFVWQEKIWVKNEVLQDAKERGKLGLSNLKYYFAVCCLIWRKKWVLLRNRKLLELKGHYLRFGLHGYLWYGKVKVKVDFKSHWVRCALLRILNRYKFVLPEKIFVDPSTRSILQMRWEIIGKISS